MLRVTVGVIAALVLSLIVAVPAQAATTEPVSGAMRGPMRADLVRTAAVVGFDAGNIISDDLFYDGSAMTQAEIQRFLDARIGSCRNSRCINILEAEFSDRAAFVSQTTGNLVCSAIKGGRMPVSEAIYRAQVACGISAKVILVTLQKEQGLVTSREPGDWNIRAAMGASCPDTAPCDPAFAGIGPQIMKGTQQLKTYRAANFAKQPGVHYIQWNPNAACGGATIRIANFATAALYNYTPYQPNAAALAAGYGLGDSCSSYGNRNFYNYYTDWFGTTQSRYREAIDEEYAAQGGVSALGAPVSDYLRLTKNGGGYARAYASGSIYWTASTGAKTLVLGPVRDYYFAHGGADGALGWPSSNLQAVATGSRGGVAQAFTDGSVYAGPRGTYAVGDPMRGGYFAYAGATGPLGWPTIDQVCYTSGCRQNFEGGVVVSADAGAFGVLPPVLAAYDAAGGVTGSWGVPLMNAATIAANGGGSGQAFSKGSAYARNGGGVFFVSGQIRDFYFSLKGAEGRLGFPVAAAQCSGSTSCQQQFQNGWVLWSAASGARIGDPAIDAAYAAAGGANGPLGARVSDLLQYSENGGGFAEAFTHGAVYFKPAFGKAYPVLEPVRGAYFAQGGAVGRYGWPTSEVACAGGACRQNFEGGVVVSADAGAFGVLPPVLAAYDAAGGVTGSWGVPLMNAATIAANGGGSGQAFSKGSAYARNGGGVFFVSGQIRDFYFSLKGAEGRLGFPVAAAQCSGSTSCQQQFQNGWVLWSAASGARIGDPAIDAAYAAAGGANGPLGARVSDLLQYSENGGGFAEVFGYGSIFRKGSASEAYAVTGAVRDLYFANGGAAGRMGWPISSANCAQRICRQDFEGGNIVSTGDGTHAVVDPVRKAYEAAGGATGAWGAPTSGLLVVSENGGGRAQAFAGASVYYRGDNVVVPVVGAVRDEYFRRGGAAGPLGFPVAPAVCSGGVCSQAFDNGTVVR
jgi:uncharacterized protein with LGFP repeats